MTDLNVTDLLDAEDAPIWSPAKEDTRDHDRTLVGVIVDIGQFVGDFDPAPIYTVDRGDDGAGCNPAGRFVKWFAFGKVAAGELDRHHPIRVGDKLGVRFKGFGEVQKGATRGKLYPLYRVVVQHAHPPDSADEPAPEPLGPGPVQRDVEKVGGSDIPTADAEFDKRIDDASDDADPDEDLPF